MVTKNKGELGVKNLKLQNIGLLLKHLDKFYNKAAVPWVYLIWSSYYQAKVPHLAAPRGSFWWKDILKLQSVFRELSIVLSVLGT